jgi:hypothetical protein
MRWGASVAVVLSAFALAAAAPAGASPGAAFGLQDDAWLMYGPGTLPDRVATLQGLGVHLVRFTLRWDQIAAAQPADPRDPADPAYTWGQFDTVLRALHAQGIAELVTLYGSPSWANGGHAPNWLPQRGFADFAYAAAQRFPWVRMWTIWNEPNGRTFSVPVSPSLYVQRLLNPAYAQLHLASSSNLVAGGVTSPRATATGVAPLTFMQGMKAAHARLDVYAQNPYPISRGETPTHATCVQCTVMTMADLKEIRADVTKNFGGRTGLWLTEYGYQTNPPDRLLGVSYGLQATYIAAAALRVWQQPGATVLIQFLVRDEPNVGGWQSGLLTAGGTEKPSFHAFALPLAQVSRQGARAVLWGQVRPGSGTRAYVLQWFTAGVWRALGAAAHTDRSGTFQRTVTLPRGARVRLWSPAAGYAGPAVVLS